jgi:hypothetical protein
MGSYPPQPVSVLWPAPTLSPSFLMAQAIFEPTFSCINTLTIPKPSYSSYLPAYEDGTECSEMSAYKIQTSGNYPRENIQSEHCALSPRYHGLVLYNHVPNQKSLCTDHICHYVRAWQYESEFLPWIRVRIISMGSSDFHGGYFPVVFFWVLHVFDPTMTPSL